MKSIRETHFDNINAFDIEDLRGIVKKTGPIDASMPQLWNKDGMEYRVSVPIALDEDFLKNCSIEKKLGQNSLEISIKHKEGLVLRIFFADKDGKNIDLSGPEGKDIPESLKSEAKNIGKKSKITEWFKEKYGVDSSSRIKTDQTRFSYVNQDGTAFILTTQVNFSSESTHQGNDPGLKNPSRTFVEEGLLKDRDGKILNVQNYIYVMNKEGELFLSPQGTESGARHHSYIIKSEEGYGKPIACGGHLDIKDGKITRIDNGSGHYRPNEEQLIMAAAHLYKKGLVDFSTDIQFQGDKEFKKLNLQEILEISPPRIVAKYPPLEYYEKKPPSQKKKPQSFQPR